MSARYAGEEGGQFTASSSAGNRASWKISSASLSLSLSAEADLSGSLSGAFELAVSPAILCAGIILIVLKDIN